MYVVTSNDGIALKVNIMYYKTEDVDLVHNLSPWFGDAHTFTLYVYMYIQGKSTLRNKKM